MTPTDLYQYCAFYKGEFLCPSEYEDGTKEKIWLAEKIIVEDMSSTITDDNPHLQLAQLVSAYVQKWAPFTFRETMEVYFDIYPQLRSKIL